jgi:hypothetical protein
VLISTAAAFVSSEENLGINSRSRGITIDNLGSSIVHQNIKSFKYCLRFTVFVRVNFSSVVLARYVPSVT